jgi:hypothetical protein
LGAYDFLKRTSIIEASPDALKALGPEVARLARMEGFEGHARAMEARLAPKADQAITPGVTGKRKRVSDETTASQASSSRSKSPGLIGKRGV